MFNLPVPFGNIDTYTIKWRIGSDGQDLNVTDHLPRQAP